MGNNESKTFDELIKEYGIDEVTRAIVELLAKKVTESTVKVKADLIRT